MKLEDFENNNSFSNYEYKAVPKGTYVLEYEKVASKKTLASGYSLYSLQFKILEGEYANQKIFVNFFSGWTTKDGKQGSHISNLRVLLKLALANNINDNKLKLFYKNIMTEDVNSTEEFFEKILDSNKLNGCTVGNLYVGTQEGKAYIDGNGNKKEGRTQYQLSLTKEIEQQIQPMIDQAMETMKTPEEITNDEIPF